jgi:hypothetical protein
VVRGRKGAPAADGCRARRNEFAVTPGWTSDSALVVNADRIVLPDPGHSHEVAADAGDLLAGCPSCGRPSRRRLPAGARAIDPNPRIHAQGLPTWSRRCAADRGPGMRMVRPERRPLNLAVRENSACRDGSGPTCRLCAPGPISAARSPQALCAGASPLAWRFRGETPELRASVYGSTRSTSPVPIEVLRLET